MKRVLRDVGAFFRGHWPHLLIGIPGALGVTAVHELAHCVGVWVQGGTVTEFVWLPSMAAWGHMRYVFPEGVPYSGAVISLCPYALWGVVCLVACGLALRRSAWPFWFASSVYVWLFIVPVADVANAALPYLLWDVRTDFRDAFGPSSAGLMAVGVVLAGVVAVWGYFLSRRLYRERAVGLGAYCVLVGVAIVGVLGMNGFGLK